MAFDPQNANEKYVFLGKIIIVDKTDCTFYTVRPFANKQLKSAKTKPVLFFFASQVGTLALQTLW